MDGENENLLEAALTQAFSAPPSRRQSTLLHGQNQGPTDLSQLETKLNEAEGTAQPRPETAAAESLPSSSSDEPWKAEYESHVQSWRTQSAEAREKAERERERWEAIRAVEKEAAASRKLAGDDIPSLAASHEEPEWENVSKTKASCQATTFTGFQSPSPADARDLVAGESEKQSLLPIASASSLSESHAPLSQPDTGDESSKWEDVQASVTSSFPSMTYPERTETPSPSQVHTVPPPAPLSATLTIFDSSLSTKTRLTALFSSLAINMLLPFVNGVMLGFGEIFAKDVVMGWLGWKPSRPGSTAATTGIRGASPWRR